MSWLSDITDSITDTLGLGKWGTSIANFIDPDVVSSVTGSTTQSGGGNDDLWASIIGAGTGLAGIYANQSSGKSNAEAYAANQDKLLAFEKEKFDQEMALKKEALAKSGGGSGAAVAAAKIAAQAQKRNTLANLYNNWAQLTARGGESLANQANNTGDAMTKALNLRVASLGK